MSKLESVLKELLHIKDEMALQAHLLEMDLKDDWHALEKKLAHLESKLEHDLVTLSKKVGHAEEEYFVGDEQEIESLLSQFRDLKDKAGSGKDKG